MRLQALVAPDVIEIFFPNLKIELDQNRYRHQLIIFTVTTFLLFFMIVFSQIMMDDFLFDKIFHGQNFLFSWWFIRVLFFISSNYIHVINVVDIDIVRQHK